jgi:hypothetical protein
MDLTVSDFFSPVADVRTAREHFNLFCFRSGSEALDNDCNP